MSVLTRRTYTRVPTPLAAVGYLLAFVAVCRLLYAFDRWWMRPAPVATSAPAGSDDASPG